VLILKTYGMQFKILVLLFFSSLTFAQNFKKEQMQFSRVKQAFENKEDNVLNLLKTNKIDPKSFKVFFRAFKEVDIFEVWVTEASNEKYVLLKTYKIAARSGELGPKRKKGDRQVPEGFYKIDRFNPASDYHLSLGINYPNKADKILGNKKLGGDIFIHGEEVTIGCIPLTNDKIEEVYTLAVMAKNAGQKSIYVHIFPFEFEHKNLSTFSKNPNFELWKDLKKGDLYFRKNKRIPVITIGSKGGYSIR
jgi:murein L,D-transpeptidase YafK